MVWGDFMSKLGQPVHIKLQSTINDSGDEEIIVLNQLGRLIQKKGVDVLIYEEREDNGDKINNLITIRSDHVNIKRSGFISMNQRFKINQKTENFYQHLHGLFQMETYTHSIKYEPFMKDRPGKLAIQYTVWLNG